MKFKIILILSFFILSILPLKAQVQTDPLLNAAIGLQTKEYSDIHKKRRTIQEEILAAEATITLTMDRVHAVEEKMLNYLSNAQGAVRNLYQIKKAAQLVAVDIPDNCKKLAKAVPGHLQGTAITLMVSTQINDIYTEMATLLPFMYQLVSSGTYDITNSSGQQEAHKVNLLNSAERYYIADTIVSRLTRINTSLRVLTWQVQLLSWRDLIKGVDITSYYNYLGIKNIIKSSVNDWCDAVGKPRQSDWGDLWWMN